MGAWRQTGIVAAVKRTKFVHEREEKENVTTRRSLHFHFTKKTNHSEALERNTEMDRGAFNPTRCYVPAMSGWHLSGRMMNGNLRTLVSALCFSKEASRRNFQDILFMFLFSRTLAAACWHLLAALLLTHDNMKIAEVTLRSWEWERSLIWF